MSLLNLLEGWSYRLFGRFSLKFLGNIFELKEYLRKAGIKIYPDTYVSLMFFVAFLTMPVTITAIVLLYFFKFIPLIFLVPTPIWIMIVFMLTPIMKAGERAHALEREMPFVAAYVTVMATGGISPYMSIKRLSNVELMPAMRKESKEVIKDVEIFGMDPLSALGKSAKENPLDIYEDFFSGYASTVITGGDITHYLETKTSDIFKTRSMRIRAAAERLGMLLESFIIIMVLMSLCFYILFSVETIYSTGISIYSSILLYTYIFAPMLSVVFIYLAHDMQPKTPITDWQPYKAFAICLSVGAVVFLLLTGFMGMVQVPFLYGISSAVDLPTAFAVALFISTGPPALIQIKAAGKKLSVERGIANFLRDLTEIRKTGLAPERCIESLSKRNYGKFTKELQQISSELSWGVPLRQVFRSFLTRTKSWLSQIVVFLLVETIDVGGGTISMIEGLARFNHMTQEVEKEKRMSTRPYMIVPYFAAILLTATTLLTLVFVTKTVSIAESSQQIDLAGITTIFTVSVIFHTYMIGLVAGKISEESISAGFKHSALLVVITLLASVLVPQLVSL
ncbi:MAG: type II secretion system F family protein [Candidatus Bathyarchaeota archaeon]|nr:type II secretion system F family protein [Candidatus Bathyarchaeota archaeon]MDH5712355.1 type II secretion system F family protein [Candidatus Bathyarchaeota archaeon]